MKGTGFISQVKFKTAPALRRQSTAQAQDHVIHPRLASFPACSQPISGHSKLREISSSFCSARISLPILARCETCKRPTLPLNAGTFHSGLVSCALPRPAPGLASGEPSGANLGGRRARGEAALAVAREAASVARGTTLRSSLIMLEEEPGRLVRAEVERRRTDAGEERSEPANPACTDFGLLFRTRAGSASATDQADSRKLEWKLSLNQETSLTPPRLFVTANGGVHEELDSLNEVRNAGDAERDIACTPTTPSSASFFLSI